jgi:hypothetical protein
MKTLHNLARVIALVITFSTLAQNPPPVMPEYLANDLPNLTCGPETQQRPVTVPVQPEAVWPTYPAQPVAEPVAVPTIGTPRIAPAYALDSPSMALALTSKRE